ncbi:MAG TPA: hypothetical protein PKV80_29290 [Leptospiraceae bacterium]|nr:hypothetical protein [Leptospiraceae bacterium]
MDKNRINTGIRQIVLGNKVAIIEDKENAFSIMESIMLLQAQMTAYLAEKQLVNDFENFIEDLK